jgi:Kef-type K+ transport system membrane component KefB/nucleotide-binding universal stress UspA family protein
MIPFLPFRRTGRPALGALTLLLALVPCAALAASGATGASETLFVAQVLVLIVAGRLMGEVMERLGQPAVMGQLIAGVMLGPSLFGLVLPEWQQALFPSSPAQKSMIDAVAQVGVLILLLLAGMETDLVLVNRVRRAAATVSISGIALPFACGVLLGQVLPDSMMADPGRRLVTALFLGTALSISSVKIVAIVVRQMDFSRRNVGQVILASAIIDDTIGWIIIALTFGIASGGGLEPVSILKSVAGAAAFLVVSLTVGRRLVATAIRLTNDHFVGELPVVSTVLVIMASLALVTQALGLHTVLGAFVAGVLVGESPILTRKIEEQLRGLTAALFMPVFFGLSGLGTDLTILADPHLLGLSVALVLIASIGKFAGAFVGGALGGLTMRESTALACGMNARGSTEVVVATIGLSMGVLTQTLFTMIVAMAVITTLAMPPTLRWALRRLPLRPEEKERLAREAFESSSFVARFERLLVLADPSPGGRFVTRLAGLLAGPLGIPVTTLVPAGQSAEPAEEAQAVVRSGADEGRGASGEGGSHRDVDVTARPVAGSPASAVAEEARRGYDMLLAAWEPDDDDGPDLPATLAAFEGPAAIARVRGMALAKPDSGPRRIIVPVNGTPASRRGLEVALLLARAARSEIVAVHVLDGRRPGMLRGLTLGRRPDLAVLREAGRMAEALDVRLATRLERRADPVGSVLGAASQDVLVVMGVTRRPGEGLRFGTVPDAVLARSTASVLLVAT